MPIRKNFKTVSGDESQTQNTQVEITVTTEEKEKMKECLTDFFSSVKTLLAEGAVLIDDEGESKAQSLEEEFLENPYSKKGSTAIYSLLINTLSEEKAEKFKQRIRGVKMSEEYNFAFDMESEAKESPNSLKKYLESIISTELKGYIKELPAIMEKRKEKLLLLMEVRPDIKKYLENTKK